MAFSDFLTYAIQKLVKSEVNISLTNTTNVMFGEENRCSGWFSGSDEDTLEDRQFCVAMNNPNAQGIFVHEYSHFLQWRNKKGIWYDIDVDKESNFWEWLDGNKKMSKKSLREISLLIGAVEADAERRSVGIIKKWDIDINLKEYKRKANTYIFFYTVIPDIGSWYSSGTPPYEIPEIMDLMPNTFLSDYSNPPEGYLELIKKHCIGE